MIHEPAARRPSELLESILEGLREGRSVMEMKDEHNISDGEYSEFLSALSNLARSALVQSGRPSTH